MREYKFRGKRLDNGEWVQGYFLVAAGMPFISAFGERSPILVIPETVGQYTGLPDKNGKESYEHDIIKIYMHNGLYPDEWIAEIVFEKGQFGIRYGDLYKEFYPLAAFFKSTKKEYIPNVGEVTIESEPMFEVIGNPWDNPELLKEGSV
jgi:uncharacterized phage protein (TIGR01671 family)